MGSSFSSGKTDASNPSGTVVVTGGILVDETGDNPVSDGGVVVENGRIIDVGPADSLDVPTDATEIDVDGQTIMPGLVEAHTHMPSTRN